VNQVIAAAEIEAGHLKFVPVSGMVSSDIGFRVTDGISYSALAYKMMVYAENVETLTDGDNTVGDTIVNVPDGVTAESRTLDSGLGTYEQLYAFVDSNEQPDVIANQELIHQQIDDYLASHPDAPQPQGLTLSSGLAGDVVTINGDASGDDVLVIDASALPHGTVIDLNNIGFAIIIGPGHYEGGGGSNIIVADGGSQFIILGEDDDTTHGGAGDDTIGSTEGHDDLYGDEDNDVVFGGLGNDTLHGGTGDDTIAGGSVTVHDDGTHTVNDDSGNDHIYGGDGDDTIEFSGIYHDYHFSYDNVTGSWAVEDTVAGNESTDTVTEAEHFMCADGTHEAAAHNCTVDVTYWKSGAAINGVTSTMTDTGNGQETDGTVNGGGEYGYTGLIEGEYKLLAEKTISDSEIGSINSLDVLYTLKLALGANPNSQGTAISSYQYLAANAFKDGQIDSLDVLNVLKIALEINKPQWDLVSDSVGSEVMDENNVQLPDTALHFSLINDAKIDLVGVLVGDVDGTMSFS
jgi:hypothetical protein